jgi:hypothetical protein
VLFDVQLSNLDGRFSTGDFTQAAPEMPREAWQVAYDEAVLSEDGIHVLSRAHRCTDGLKDARIGFYLHFFDRLTPMVWTYGEYSCPPVKEIPERLAEIMPYELLD